MGEYIYLNIWLSSIPDCEDLSWPVSGTNLCQNESPDQLWKYHTKFISFQFNKYISLVVQYN